MINVFFDMEITDALKLSSSFIATFFKHHGLYYKTFYGRNLWILWISGAPL
jgi:hypothetical protein